MNINSKFEYGESVTVALPGGNFFIGKMYGIKTDQFGNTEYILEMEDGRNITVAAKYCHSVASESESKVESCKRLLYDSSEPDYGDAASGTSGTSGNIRSLLQEGEGIPERPVQLHYHSIGN